MEKNFIKVDKWGTCLWGIDDEGKLFINEGTAESIDSISGAPWAEYADQITEASAIGEVIMPEGSSLAGMFKGCKRMQTADLSGLVTNGVTDMHSMFEGCNRLREIDLSAMDTTSCSNMKDMFKRCGSLTDIIMGEGFSLTGDGTTECERLAVKQIGKYRHARVIAAGGASIFYYENNGADTMTEKKAVAGIRYTIEDALYSAPDENHIFLGWNTERDGSGTLYTAGQELDEVEEDMALYAIWATPPVISEVRPLREITYGDELPFELPEIASENDPQVTGYLEISPDGEEGTWKAIAHNALLPVSCNGYLLRLCASNSVGTSYSNPVMIHINRANIDMSAVRWVESGDMTYDGTAKRVWLEGLPAGVNAAYAGNEATEAGEYTATVDLEYDADNFNKPIVVREHSWSIRKASFDMSAVRWDYAGPFDYDGEAKSVELVGIPAGVTATVSGNTATNAGVYTATASLDYDRDNFERPAEVPACAWEIRKAVIETAGLSWTSDESFVYDGTPKKVAIENLPEGVEIEYLEDEEIPAGKYLARGTLYGNYCADGPIEYEWEVRKASYDMSDVKWDYEGPFTFDGQIHTVSLTGIPEGLNVRYYDNAAAHAGEYTARAVFTNEDSHNYETPQEMEMKWSVVKTAIDMSGVKWNYTEPFTYDGTNKSIELTGVPDGVFVTYDNAAATNAGVYMAHANLKYDKENFELQQPADCQWQINKAEFDMSGVRWDYPGAFTYDGTEHGFGLAGLPAGLNAEYKDNKKIEAGKYVATATLIPSDPGNYDTPEINGCTWAINKAELEHRDFVWTDSSDFVYDGTPKSVSITSEIDERLKVEYSGNTETNAGRYYATAVFTPTDENNYSAPKPVKHVWNIARADHSLTGVSWNYANEFTYDGTAKSVALNNVPEGVAVRYSNAEANEAGDYTAVASFEALDKGNYNNNIPDMTLDWTVNKAKYDLSGVKWQESRGFSYDGSDKEVKLTGLPEGLEPVYSGNLGVAAADYVASASFNYDERNYEKPEIPECRWSIERAPIDVSDVTWDYDEEEAFVYDGREKSVSVANLPEGAYVEYSNASAVEAGTYIASADIIAEDSDNLLNSSIGDLTWKIEKGDYDMSHAYWDYVKPFTYDGTEQKVVLKGVPEGVYPVYKNNTARDAGTYEASVTFRIADEDNYKVPQFDNCTWTIKKADPDMSAVSWNYTGPFTYSSRMNEVVLTGLPDGVRVVYAGNAAAEAGSYEATAEITPLDPDNWNTPTVPVCNWQVAKADYDMSGVQWDYSGPKAYNGREQSVMLEYLPAGVSAEYTGNVATEVGNYTARAALSVSDTRNYNVPSVSVCEWEISKADYDMSGVTWDYTTGELVYDGTEKEITLKDLPSDVTATYTGNKGTDAGNYTATATFATDNSNFSAPASEVFNWSIGKIPCDMSGVKWDYNSAFTYDGKNKEIRLRGLPKTVKALYDGNVATEAGTYQATARFEVESPNYETPEPMTCSWAISKGNPDIRNVRWDYSQPFTYNGELRTVVLAGLPDGINVTYSGNAGTTVGSYVAHAELSPEDAANYNVPAIPDCPWEIVKADYDLTDAEWSAQTAFTYDGTEKGVYLTGLPEGVTPVYTGNTAVNAGTYQASADLNYDELNYNKPEIEGISWSIGKTTYDMSGVTWDYGNSFTYDGGSKEIRLTGLPEGVTPVYSGNTATESGEYNAEVSFEYDSDNYEAPSFGACRWAIGKTEAPIDPSSIKWDYEGPFVYDGTPKRIGFANTVVEVQEEGFFNKLLGKKSTMQVSGVPEGYDVEYIDNEKTEAGEYTARAILRSRDNANYNEFEIPSCRWEIKKATFDMSGVEWSSERKFVYDGEEKGVELTGVPEGVIVNYKDNAATDAGSYEALATFEAEDAVNYEAPKPVKGCWWRIEKAAYDMSGVSWVYDGEFTYNGKEKSVKLTGLPDGVRVESYRGNKGIDAGNYTAEANLRFRDKANFETPSVPALKWKINKKKIDTSEMRWDYDESTLFVYDEQPKEVKLVGVPDEIEVVYVDNRKINAGEYTARANLTYDRNNCEADGIDDLKWTIEKANFDTSDVYWNYDKPFRYDAYEKSISLKNVPAAITVRYRDNKASAIGTYTAKAYLTYDSENYNPPEIETTFDWEIAGRE